MHDYKCVKTCPAQYERRDDGRCILTGFFCPFGYDYNMKGNACILKAQVCPGYDILNFDKTKCIPMPGILIPFPLCLIAIGCAIYIYLKKKKHPSTRFYPTMICVLSVLESIGLFFLVGLTSDYGIKPSYSLAACALLFLFGLNLFSAIIYFKQIKTDVVFKYWEQEFQLPSFFIVTTGFFLNFKVYRMFYSRFMDKKEYNAVFKEPGVFYKFVFFSSAFYVLTGTVPIVVASCFGLWYIKFGYQVQMFCIEMIIIELALVILMSFELHKISKHILGKQYAKVRPSEIGSQYKVMAGVPDAETKQLLKDTDETLLLKHLLHRMAVKDAGKRNENEYGTIQEIQDLYEQQFLQKQMRRCMSFRELRDYQDYEDPMQQLLDSSDESDNEFDKQFNFISEPNSPRSKEML